MREVKIIEGQPYQQQTKLIEGFEHGLRAFLVPYSVEGKTLAYLWAMGFRPDVPKLGTPQTIAAERS